MQGAENQATAHERLHGSCSSSFRDAWAQSIRLSGMTARKDAPMYCTTCFRFSVIQLQVSSKEGFGQMSFLSLHPDLHLVSAPSCHQSAWGSRSASRANALGPRADCGGIFCGRLLRAVRVVLFIRSSVEPPKPLAALLVAALPVLRSRRRRDGTSAGLTTCIPCSSAAQQSLSDRMTKAAGRGAAYPVGVRKRGLEPAGLAASRSASPCLSRSLGGVWA